MDQQYCISIQAHPNNHNCWCWYIIETIKPAIVDANAYVRLASDYYTEYPTAVEAKIDAMEAFINDNKVSIRIEL